LLAAAADGPNRVVAGALEDAAATAAARGAPATAGELAERAAELTPEDDGAEHQRRMIAAAHAHTLCGDGARARKLLEHLVTGLEAGHERAVALVRLSYVAAFAGGADIARQALVEAEGDDEIVAEAHEILACLLSYREGVAAALPHAESAVRHAERSGRPALQSLALVRLATLRFLAGEGVQRALLKRAESLEATGAPHPHAITTPLLTLALQLAAYGELEAARELAAAELARAQASAKSEHEMSAYLRLGNIEVEAGRIEEADRHADALLELAESVETHNAIAAARALKALVDATRGRTDAAQTHAELAIVAARAAGDRRTEARAEWILGALALASGNTTDAITHLEPAHRTLTAAGVGGDARLHVLTDLAEALALAGESDRARSALTDLSDSDAPGVRRCRGAIAAADGRYNEAIAEHHAALELLSNLARPIETARTLLALGIAQRRAKRRGEALASLRSARQRFAEVGATLWQHRTEAEIARLGGRRTAHDDELTPTEQRIAELVADGRRNREIAALLFVSERTVETNLTRIYRKLGVTSRTQLARRVNMA